jgi:hypothetical protein
MLVSGLLQPLLYTMDLKYAGYKSKTAPFECSSLSPRHIRLAFSLVLPLCAIHYSPQLHVSFPRTMDAQTLATLGEQHPSLQCLTPDSAEYSSLREAFKTSNASPQAILCPRNVEEVSSIIRAANKCGTSVTVRSGGHDLYARSYQDGVICVDMRKIDQVVVHPDQKTAIVGGGALTETVETALAKEGLITPFGAVGSVGYVGWASGAGYGCLSPQWGLGIDQILGAEVVTATGDVVQADTEMLTGIRGAGGNFGVIVSLRIKVYRLKSVRIPYDKCKHCGQANIPCSFLLDF